jgi:NADH dehydrogenase
MSADDVARASIISRRKVVVIGAGFAGIAVVRELRDSDAEVTLVDRNNHHLSQPYLFQVATSILEPAEIATPIRSLLNEMPNVRMETREAKRVDMSDKESRRCNQMAWPNRFQSAASAPAKCAVNLAWG